MKSSIISFMKDAYRIDLSDSQWYPLMAQHLASLMMFAEGVMVYKFDARDLRRGVMVEQWASYGVPDRFVSATLALNRASGPDESRIFYHSGILCGTVSEQLSARPSENASYHSSVVQRGYPDTFGLTASSPTHEGIVVNAPLREVTALNPRIKDRWRRVGVHLQAAYRLRTALAQASAEPELVLRPDGSVVHAEQAARAAITRERLRALVTRLDRLGRTSRNPTSDEDPLQIWQGLIDGRWSLVESFDADGRRFFLAYANEHEIPNPKALSKQERIVVSLAAQGDSNKWIAYQLGIAQSTVATHLNSAMKKLGVRARSELIWLYLRI